MRKKPSLIISLLLVIILPTIFYIHNESLIVDQKKTEYSNIPPGIKENSGVITHGLYEPNGKLIDNGSPMAIPDNGRLEKVVSFSRFNKIVSEYGLINLVDFEQVDFEVEGTTFRMYPLMVEPNETANIHTVVNIGNDTKEIVYLIVPKPNYLLEEKDTGKALYLQELYSMRFHLVGAAQKAKTDISYIPPKETTNINPITDMSLSQLKDRSRLIFQGKSGQRVYLRICDEKKDMEYALIALLDWNQVPFLNSKVNFVQVPKGQTYIFQMELPQTSKKVNYQIIALPKPFAQKKDLSGTSAIATRVVVSPDSPR